VTFRGYGLVAQHPIALAILGVLAVVVIVRLWRADVSLGRARRVAASLCAVIALLCAVLAAGEVELVRPADRMSVVVALDRSRSIDRVAGAEAKVQSELSAAELQMRKDDRLAVVRFGATAALAEPMHVKGEGGVRADPSVGRDASDLEAAIRRSVDEVLAAGGGRVVLVSDGVSTRGDPLVAAARARALGVPVDVVVLEQQTLPDVRVVTARGPSLADEGETIEIRTVVHSPQRKPPAPPDAKLDAEVTVTRDGQAIATFKTALSGGEDVIRWKDRAPLPGLHRYDVHVRPLDATSDASADDNEASTFVRVRGPSTVLVLQSEEAKAGPLRQALEAEGYRVVVRGKFGVPYDLAEFAAFDLIVLADIPARELVPAQMSNLAKYVKDFGGGLLLLGSDQSLGPGGYARTPIEEISPLTFDLLKQRRRSQLSELIVIDYSGSMAAIVDGNVMKIDLANEAAARAAALLGTGDRLGVWHVDTAISETIPLGPLGDPKAAAKKIRSVGPGGGGIFIDLSLREGYKALAKEPDANLRHLILFSDGADAEEREEAPNLVRKAAALKITTSVISLGDGPDANALSEMAKLGGGRFYLITDARKLPAVFAQETVLAAQSSLREQEFVPHVRSDSAAIRGIDWKAAPSLRGYVVTQAKPRAQVLLDGLEGDPLLALWPLGLGHVATWTSDFTDVWAGPFLKWGGAAQLATQLAREIGRKADEARVRLEATAKDGVLHVEAEPTGLAGSSGLMHLKAHVEGPGEWARDVELLPAPGGGYAIDVPITAPGAYVVRASDDPGGAAAVAPAVGLAATVFSRADELRTMGSDRRALERVAQLSGGQVVPTLADVFARRVGMRPTALPLAPFLLPAALAFMLLGVAARRLGVPSFLIRLASALSPRKRPARAAPRLDKIAPPIAQATFTPKPTTATKQAEQVDLSSLQAPPRVARQAPQATGAVSGVAAAIAQKRKEAAPKTSAPVAPVIVRPAARPRAEAEKPGVSSLADLAAKKREKNK
jgi:uncharacterized membrane protein